MGHSTSVDTDSDVFLHALSEDGGVHPEVVIITDACISRGRVHVDVLIIWIQGNPSWVRTSTWVVYQNRRDRISPGFRSRISEGYKPAIVLLDV